MTLTTATLIHSRERPERRPRASTLVVIPTLNEAENIQSLLRRIRVAAPSVDVLVVDDSSSDGTATRAEEIDRELGHITILKRHGGPGLGRAYRDGFAYAVDHGYAAVVEMDADLSHDPATIPALLESLDDGADLVIGSRYIAGGATPGWPRRRRFLSRIAGWYARQLLRLPSTDPTGGFRVFRTNLLRQADVGSIHANGFAFQLEMLHRATRLRATIAEVPIVFNDRTAGSSKLTTSIVREALWLVAELRLNPWSPLPARLPVDRQPDRAAPTEPLPA